MKCPECGSKKISLLMAAFWVPVDEEGLMVGEWSSYECSTELTDEAQCVDCGHEFEFEPEPTAKG